jgi:predicted Zn-dependent protease
MADEWFRSDHWSTKGQEDFEQRLRRARAFNRPQYLRIKALALLGNGGKAEARGARELLVRVVENYPEAGDVVMAHEHLAELDLREGQRASAKDHYRTALRLAPERHVYGDAALRLPELLIEDGEAKGRSEAESLLANVADQNLVFSSQRFRYAVARARLAQAAGNVADARRYAGDALREVAREAPDFARHPDVGFVDADRESLKELRRLAET